MRSSFQEARCTLTGMHQLELSDEQAQALLAAWEIGEHGEQHPLYEALLTAEAQIRQLLDASQDRGCAGNA